MSKALFLLMTLILASSSVFAQGHKGIPVEVLITKPDGTKLTSSDFSVISQIVSPNGCILLEEFYSNQSVTDGLTTLVIGKGLRTSDDNGFPMLKVFSNTNPLTGLRSVGGSGNDCSYAPSKDDERMIRMNLHFAHESLVVEFLLKSVPYAIVADEANTLQGLAADQFLRRNDSIGLNQLNFERMFQAFQTNSIPVDSIASATKTSKGVVQIGTGLDVNGGLISIGSGAVTSQMLADDISITKFSGVGLLAFKNQVTDIDIGGSISASKISGLGSMALTNSISFDDVTGQLNVSKITGLGSFAVRNSVEAGDINGDIPASKISGLGSLATKSTVTDTEISGEISVSKISGLGPVALWPAGTGEHTVALGNDTRFPSTACPSGKKMRWSGTDWICEDDLGAQSASVKTVSANYTLTASDETIEVDTSGGTRTITLPTASTFKGASFTIIQSSSANQVILSPASGTICGQSSIRLSGLRDVGTYKFNGTNYVGMNKESCFLSQTYNVNLNTSSCSLVEGDGNAFSFSSRTAVGFCNGSYNTSSWSVTPRCTCTTYNSVTGICDVTSIGGGGIQLRTAQSTSNNSTDYPFFLTCSGKR